MSDEANAFWVGAAVAAVVALIIGFTLLVNLTASSYEQGVTSACGATCERGAQCGEFTCTAENKWR